ncbi:MAG: hypothetical protein KDB07_09520 [Planctomycetes bacterium]|nr:hypothetical protein [Planctomycetota bacterium]
MTLATSSPRALLMLALCGLLGIFATSAQAAVVQHFTLAELTAKADIVVHAKVSSESAAWDQGLTKIWTTYGLEVKETIKGAFPAAAQAHARGGSVGRKSQQVAGEATLVKGSEYLLFLWKDSEGRQRCVGMAQGAFLVTTKGQETTAKNSFRGLKLVNVNGKALAEKVGPISGKLSDLITQIKALLPAPAADDKKGGE